MFLLIVLLSISCIDKGYSLKVSLSIDDNLSDHYQMAQDLASLNTKGVFYINSGRIGSEGYLTLQQLYEIADMGHEIGGHTQLHLKLTELTYEQQKEAICQDRNQLLEWGFNATTFAVPFGADTPDVFKLLGECGYNGARDSGGIRTNESCTKCPKSDEIPPANPQQIRSISYRSEMRVDGLKWFVREAFNDPEYNNGLIVFIFHEYGDYPNKESSILQSEFIEFVEWLKNETIDIVRIDETIETYVYPNFDELPLPSSSSTSSLHHGGNGNGNNGNNGNGNGNQPVYTPDKGNLFLAFTFDDGTEDHYIIVSQLLEKYDFRGTFFINTGRLNKTGFMNNAQLIDMESRGHEIGGHSYNQSQRLLNLSQEEQLFSIQTDYDILTDMGLTVNSFAWPFGETSQTLKDIISTVGYIRARDIGGIKVPTSCFKCPSALKLPLSDDSVLAIRSFNVKSFHTLGNLMWQVFRAEEWIRDNPEENALLVFTFHTICDGCEYNPSTFESFLQWLYPRSKIKTQNELIKNVVL